MSDSEDDDSAHSSGGATPPSPQPAAEAPAPVLPALTPAEARAQRLAALEKRASAQAQAAGGTAAAASPSPSHAPPPEPHPAAEESAAAREVREARARAAEARLAAAPKLSSPLSQHSAASAAAPAQHHEETALETEARLVRARAAEARAAAGGGGGGGGGSAQPSSQAGSERERLWGERVALEAEAERQRKASGSVSMQTTLQLASLKETIAHLYDSGSEWAALRPAERKEVGIDLARKQEYARLVRAKEEQRLALLRTALEAQEQQAARELKAQGAVSALTQSKIAALQHDLAPPIPLAALPPEEAIPRLVAGLAGQAEGALCRDFLAGVAGKVLGSPEEPKFRRLRCSAGAFQERVLGVAGGRELLLLAGFEAVQEAGEGGRGAEDFLRHPGQDFALLRLLTEALARQQGAAQ